MKNPVRIDKIKAKATPDPTAMPAISALLRSGLPELLKSEDGEGDKVVEVERGKACDVVAAVVCIGVLPDDMLLVDVTPEQELPEQHM
jgi:hypothetical protein